MQASADGGRQGQEGSQYALPQEFPLNKAQYNKLMQARFARKIFHDLVDLFFILFLFCLVVFIGRGNGVSPCFMLDGVIFFYFLFF